MGTQRFPEIVAENGYRPVALGLGSNLEPRLLHLRGAIEAIEAFVSSVRCSSVYETEPMHVLDQPRFLNACCVGWTKLEPEPLLDVLKGVERKAGRAPGGVRYGPRVLDIDILLYGDAVVGTERLVVPHPRLAERAFVLVPLAEIAGSWVHPHLAASIDELAAGVDQSGVEATNLHLTSRQRHVRRADGIEER